VRNLFARDRSATLTLNARRTHPDRVNLFICMFPNREQMTEIRKDVPDECEQLAWLESNVCGKQKRDEWEQSCGRSKAPPVFRNVPNLAPLQSTASARLLSPLFVRSFWFCLRFSLRKLWLTISLRAGDAESIAVLLERQIISRNHVNESRWLRDRYRANSRA